MLDLQSIGENIRTLRVNKGLSQDYIAELLGVSHQAVSRWENGLAARRSCRNRGNGLAAPSVDNIAELCEVFDVSFEQLLCLDRKIQWDAKDIFKGHSRMFVVKQIVSGQVEYDVVSNLYVFMPQERLLILRAIKEGKLQVDLNKLYCKITPDEQRYLGGKK